VSAGIDSAQATGSIALGVVSLLPGDAKQPGNDPNILTTGMQCNGGFVSVPFSKDINPSAPFTIECWVRPEWTAGDAPAFRMIVDNRFTDMTAFTGFGLEVNNAGNWEGQVGVVGSPGFVTVAAGKAELNVTTHLVLTCDGNKATLFVNGASAASVTLGAAFAPNAQGPLIIGAGLPWLPPRMNSTGDNFFPIVPFNGTIQDVALYNTVLDEATILQHFNDGSGKTTVPAG
jgi:hypothetical protein